MIAFSAAWIGSHLDHPLGPSPNKSWISLCLSWPSSPSSASTGRTAPRWPASPNRARIKKERLYKYFGDKQALFETVLTGELDKLAASVAGPPAALGRAVRERPGSSKLPCGQQNILQALEVKRRRSTGVRVQPAAARQCPHAAAALRRHEQLSGRMDEFARLEALQREIQAGIGQFRAAGRLSRDEVHDCAVR
jgi:AcrR family transcriptional regulator